jgi:hypothetical protein
VKDSCQHLPSQFVTAAFQSLTSCSLVAPKWSTKSSPNTSRAMLSGLIIALVASANEPGSKITYSQIVSVTILQYHLLVHLLPGWVALVSGNGWRRELELFGDAPHAQLEDGTQSKVGIHVGTRYTNFKSCCRWWNGRWRDDADGSRTRIVPVCNCIRSPKSFTANETFVAIDCWNKLLGF